MMCCTGRLKENAIKCSVSGMMLRGFSGFIAGAHAQAEVEVEQWGDVREKG